MTLYILYMFKKKAEIYKITKKVEEESIIWSQASSNKMQQGLSCQALHVDLPELSSLTVSSSVGSTSTFFSTGP